VPGGGYSTRKAAFKQLDSCINNLDWAMEHLHNVQVDYNEQHPDISDVCEQFKVAILNIQLAIIQFRKSF